MAAEQEQVLPSSGGVKSASRPRTPAALQAFQTLCWRPSGPLLAAHLSLGILSRLGSLHQLGLLNLDLQITHDDWLPPAVLSALGQLQCLSIRHLPGAPGAPAADVELHLPPACRKVDIEARGVVYVWTRDAAAALQHLVVRAAESAAAMLGAQLYPQLARLAAHSPEGDAHICCCCSRLGCDGSAPVCVFDLDRFPRLEQLEVLSDASCSLRLRASQPAEHLTALRLRGPEPAPLNAVAGQLGALRRLELQCCGDAEGGDDHVAVCLDALPRLESLTLGAQQSCEVWASAPAPALTELRLLHGDLCGGLHHMPSLRRLALLAQLDFVNLPLEGVGVRAGA